MRKFLVLASLVLTFAGRSGAAVLPAEKMLPDDTVVMVTVPDFNKLRDIYQNSPHGRFWNDPAMKDFRDKFTAKLTENLVTPLEHQLGIHFEDYTNLPQGQLTIGLAQNGWQAREGQMPGFLLLLDTQSQSNQLKTNLTDLKKKWVDAGKPLKMEKIRDVEFTIVVLSPDVLPMNGKKSTTNASGDPATPDAADAKPAPKTDLYIGQAESLLIVGNSSKVIEKILASMAGGDVKILGDTSAFQANAGQFRDAPLYGWVNAKAIVDVFGHPSEEPDNADPANPLAFKPEKLIAALGFSGVRTVAFNANNAPEGMLFNATLGVPEAGRAGIFKILAGEPKEYNAPAFVPADAVKFQRWRIDGQKTWAELRKIVKDISPSGVGLLDFTLSSAEAGAKEKDPNFSLEKNLFGNLGDDVITYEKNPKAGSADLDSAPSIMLIGSPNAEQLANALKTVLVLYSQQMGTATEREFLGHKIYSIPLPASPGPDGAAPTNHSMSYVSSGGYLALSTDNAILEEYLRSSENQGKSLRDTPGLTDAAQKVAGTGTSLFGYANESESMRAAFENLKKSTNSSGMLGGFAPLAMMIGVNDVKTSDWVDLSLLPTFDKVSKYFYFSVYGMSATADGLNFKIFAPVPPQMKN